MTRIQVMGPKSGNSGPVSFRTCTDSENGVVTNKVLVSIKLGSRLRQAAPPAAPASSGSDSTRPNVSPQRITRSSAKASPEKRGAEELPRTVEPEKEPPQMAPLWPVPERSVPPLLHPQNTPPAQPESSAPPPEPATQKDTDSESELEVLEVRVLPQRSRPQQLELDEEDSDLSSLDDELNHALSSTNTVPTQLVTSPRKEPEPQRKPFQPPLPMHKLLPTLYKPIKLKTSPAPPGYRNIPPNLVCAIQRELNTFFDTGGDDQDDLEVVGKIVFSLKDPYSATKIALPVKATTCRHFECFDFDNFCTFSKMPAGIRHSLRKSLVSKSHDARRLEQLFLKQQKLISEGALSFKAPGLVYPSFSEHGQMFFSEVYCRTPPLYKCPLCDEKFGLKQLYISDIFNFFVKTTPRTISKIELVETDRYKLIDEDTPVKEERTETPDVVVLSEDESDDGEVKKESAVNKSFSAEDFNDGLDDMLTKISQDDGTWNNPVTL
ncbi:hypothetical protein FT663_03679 [Candidozyma haemuli var. vulneris]|uniref:Uncharacterized protein n=1 Tax=Candidozyma haemuli TaxID=45357 RepID=A0A2V1ARV0_9ASCO|nr:hypothetical protein CXQ85_004463 [[Candida] haemuloni]KAF3987776.1 hypothetical protein FT662_03794 [[Candida] haemuloni var. vulneris]KAF3989257.1 hypothetical protein FT663_03679 [[Candida] haemuloni var. vulneris]PVH20947.1 hypothetical protein CXQ85_004463 [[Candida] haemuloni]